jgi:hypothetical protein
MNKKKRLNAEQQGFIFIGKVCIIIFLIIQIASMISLFSYYSRTDLKDIPEYKNDLLMASSEYCDSECTLAKERLKDISQYKEKPTKECNTSIIIIMMFLIFMVIWL